MLNYSIHTYEIATQLSFDEYWEIYNILQAFNPSIEHISYPYPTGRTSHTFYFRHLSGIYGIDSIRLQRIETTQSILTSNIHIIINPYNTIHKQKHSDANIIDSNMIAEALHEINRILGTIIPHHILERLELSRLDFCVNLPFPTQQQAEEYIQLLRLGIPPKALTEHLHYDKKQHRQLPFRESILLKCFSYSFQIYSKYRQMEVVMPHINTVSAQGVVRLELRASKPKLRSLLKKYNITGTHTTAILSEAYIPLIARSEICNLVSSMVGYGDFFTFNEIKERITTSNIQTRTRNKSLEIIHCFSGKKYSSDFLKNLNISQRDWKNILTTFNKLECSPIPIPPTYSLKTFPGVASWDRYF